MGPGTEKMPWNAESHVHPTSLHHLLNPSCHIPHPECLPLQSILHPKARVTFSKCQSKHVTTYTSYPLSGIPCGSWKTKILTTYNICMVWPLATPPACFIPCFPQPQALFQSHWPLSDPQTRDSWIENPSLSFFWSRLNIPSSVKLPWLQAGSSLTAPCTISFHLPRLQFCQCLIESCHHHKTWVFLYLWHISDAW